MGSAFTERVKFEPGRPGLQRSFNHPNFGNVSQMNGGNLSSPNFGVVTAVNLSVWWRVSSTVYRSVVPASMELSSDFQV